MVGCFAPLPPAARRDPTRWGTVAAVASRLAYGRGANGMARSLDRAVRYRQHIHLEWTPRQVIEDILQCPCPGSQSFDVIDDLDDPR